jgi:multicomponent Na+:H+ antiporter subunit G
VEYVASILILAGGLLTLLASIGLLRFKDVHTRMHAATKPATLGLVAILMGAALVFPSVNPVAKLLLVMFLQFITAPVGAHLMGRAAFMSGAPLAPGTFLDDASRALRPEDAPTTEDV